VLKELKDLVVQDLKEPKDQQDLKELKEEQE
jgi:hypothetical protein